MRQSGMDHDHQLNVRYADIIVRDCEPYDVNTVRDHVQLIVEVTSESTFETDTTAKRVQYAAAKSGSTVWTGREDGTWYTRSIDGRRSWTNRFG